MLERFAPGQHNSDTSDLTERMQTSSKDWVSSLIRTCFSTQKMTRGAQDVASYSNAKHSFAFPRIMAMLGDSKTKYDQANDGKANSIGACSVWRISTNLYSRGLHYLSQARVRKADITTKLRMTYFRDDFLQVRRRCSCSAFCT